MKLLFFTTLFLFAGDLFGQTTTEEMKVIEFCDSEAQFPGGKKFLEEYFERNLNYPQDAIKNRISGIVYICFVVDVDGKIKDVEIARGICESLDKEAVRLVQQMPEWESAFTSSHGNVKTRVLLPIHFILAD